MNLENEAKKRGCCECGTYGCTVPMAINHRIEYIDICVATLVAACTAANMDPVASCCGHGTQPASVLFHDGTEILVLTREQAHETIKRYTDNSKT